MTFYPTPPSSQLTVAIGNFDGVHRGHRYLLAQAKKFADQARRPLVALTFEPHPRQVLFPETPLQRLTDAATKRERLLAQGCDAVAQINFDHTFAQMSPQQFIQQVLLDTLQARQVVVGEGFRFGHKAAGDIETLKQFPSLNVHALAPLCDEGGEVISSRRLRAAHADNDRATIAKLA